MARAVAAGRNRVAVIAEERRPLKRLGTDDEEAARAQPKQGENEMQNRDKEEHS